MLATIQEPLFRHVRTITGDDHDAEDALQEILLSISRKLGTLRDPRWFRAWAYRIATRDAVRHARRVKRDPFMLDSSELDAVAAEEVEDVLDADLIANMSSAVDSLPPASQLVIRMHYMDEMSHTEIAEALEISVGTVKSRLSYGLASLRKAVATQ